MDGNQNNPAPVSAAPKALLSVTDGVFLLVGMVIGAGIFKLPSLVASNTASTTEYMLLWVAGGVVSLCGALVYAELASRFPETGGEYRFLERALGPGTAFVFSWSRMTVIQTGVIAGVAFIFGEYASQILPLGEKSSAIWAAVLVVALTALNIAGTLPTKGLQKIMEAILIAALVLLGLAGLSSGTSPASGAAPAVSGGAGWGLAMVFVLFTYGGWNEAAYMSGEVHDARRNMTRILITGIVVVTLLYLLVNLGYVTALGLSGIRDSKAVAVDVMRLVAGDKGAVLVALIVCVSVFTTLNAAVFTGARTTWAMGRDFGLFRGLGVWKAAGSTPANALLVQGILTLVLVSAGAQSRDGFESMVAYTAPVFWTFFFLTGVTLFLFRRRGGEAPAFRVPLYPIVPVVFCAMCLYMLYSSIGWIRDPAPWAPKFDSMVLSGIIVMLIGIPLYFFSRRSGRGAAA